MAELLSQREIDKLLSALSMGEIDIDEVPKLEEKLKVKVYDFKTPQKFSKDAIRALEVIHDNYARIVANNLSSQLRTTVKVFVESINQMTYEEFIHSIPNPTILVIFKMPPLNGALLYETDPEFSFQLIDMLLGGTGNIKYRPKEFTDIDKNIILQIDRGLINSLRLAWSEILPVDIEVEGVETNPLYNQTLAPHEAVAIITFTALIGTSRSFINICVPYISIEKILDKLVIKYHTQKDDEESLKKSRESLQNRLNYVDVTMTALLGGTNITVDDFLKLNVGDVITLDNKSSNPLTIMLEEVPSYNAKPGIIGKNLGIQILDTIDKDVRNYG